MTIGEKILKLRKDNRMSQEQLAQILDVSRQALSKWELGASVPEVDKIILLSNYFKVSTDYLLKDDFDECPNPGQSTWKLDKRIVLIASTAIVLVGLILGWARGNTGVKLEYLPFSLTAPGLVVQVLGITCFEILNSMQRNNEVKAQRYLFYSINIWFIAFLPVIFVVGRFFNYIVSSYPGHLSIYYMTAAYFAFSCGVSLLCLYGYKRAGKAADKTPLNM